tara:strand:+ start:424 stop:759 length:336 start_codon:yes stop_codon:yes gene_type:complete
MPDYNKFRNKYINDSELYEEVLDKREVERITQYTTHTFPTEFKNKSYTVQTHVWKHGDKLYKIAHQYYGDIKYWWIIALWNGRATDADFFYGLEIEIPLPLTKIYRDLTND